MLHVQLERPTIKDIRMMRRMSLFGEQECDFIFFLASKSAWQNKWLKKK